MVPGAAKFLSEEGMLPTGVDAPCKSWPIRLLLLARGDNIELLLPSRARRDRRPAGDAISVSPER